MDEDSGTIAPSNVVINGVEYTPEDAQRFVELGKTTDELERKWNTKVDRVWPEYGQLSQERSQWQKEKEQLQHQIQEVQAKQQAGIETDVDIAKAKEAARKLGLTLNEDLEASGYVKKADLDKYLEERDTTQREVNRVLSEADRLEKEIDGSDGRPKFNKKHVLAYASAYDIPDLQQAYEDMHGDVLKGWKQEQISSHRNPSLKTLKPTGGAKQPSEIKVTDDNIKDLLKESLWGSKDE